MLGHAPSAAQLTSGTAPGAHPAIGHGWQLWRQPLEFLESLSTIGDLVEIRLGPQPAFVPCHPEIVWHILTNDSVYDKGGPVMDRLRDFVGNGLGTSTHKDHRRQRRLIQPAFHPALVEGHAAVMGDEISTLTRDWKDGQEIDVFPQLYGFALRTVTRTLFSTTVDAETIEVVRRSFDTVFNGSFLRMLTPPALRRIPTPANRRFQTAVKNLLDTVDRMIEAHRKEATDSGGILPILLDSGSGPDGQEMSNAEIRDHLITMLLGGGDTTAAALAWALHLLSTNPEAERRLQEEVDQVLGGRPAEWKDLSQLTFTSRVLTETLRLYPPGWLLTRTTTQEVELAGRHLPPGTAILFSPVTVQRRPDLFPDPHAFDPDRWLPERASGLPRGAFVAFGGGARKCIGDTYGMAETVLALATIASRWSLSPASGVQIRPSRLSVSLHPEHLPLRLHARRQAAAAS
ncbi:cytochrome P450 [Streptomyces sp. NBC_01465]|uniref:cytochrome P450 n=1 Tax=Streptomyces sp. NBC_01465 TaxID=2903878 RepID=UPI002E34EC11|nr:cytochrome P450 [Streptomyces sp. NBC_01465]